jgi:hypothetical protein
MPVLFAVIPVYDEPHTLAQCVANVMAVQLPPQWSLKVIVVDDASGSDTATVAGELAQQYEGANSQFQLLTHAVNLGKGAALRTGFAAALQQAADTDVVITQDGDLEYDPNDYSALLGALSHEPLSAVFGNRWEHARGGGVWRIFHAAVNRLLTFLSNQITGLDINDMETGYKLFRAPLLRKIVPLLTEDRFGIEPQMTAALARVGARVRETPIHYTPRNRGDGKKIGPLDGLRALWVIARERVQQNPESISAQNQANHLQINSPINSSSMQERQPSSDQGEHSLPPLATMSAKNTARKIILQITGFALGVALIAWCVWGAAKDPEGWQRLREASSTSLIGLLLCSLASIMISGLTFWIAARPVQTLGVQDQQWINALASMLNYAPVRLGMFVRAAYAIKVDHLRAMELVAWFASVAFTFVVALLAITAGTLAWIQFGAWTFFPTLIIIAMLGGFSGRWCATLSMVQKRAQGLERLITNPTALWGSIALHILDLFFATGRVLLSIQILGLQLNLAQACLISMASFAASLNPLGRLGFREAAVAFTAGALSIGGLAGMENKFQTLAVIESAGEALVAIPVGMLALYPIWKRFKLSKQARAQAIATNLNG